MESWKPGTKQPWINTDYYRNLPPVPHEPKMKSYITMYPVFVPSGWKPYCDDTDVNTVIQLLSEELSSPEEAEHFARAVEKHCYCSAEPHGNIVCANIRLRQITANWRDDLAGFEFANWA